MVRKYLTPIEMFNALTSLREVNWKIDHILTLCDNNWSNLPGHTKISILKILKIQEDTDGYYKEYANEKEIYNDSLQSVVNKIKKEIYEN